MSTERRESEGKSGLTRREALITMGAAITGAVLPIPFVHAKEKVTLRMINQEPDPGTLQFFQKAFAEWEEKTGVKVLMDTVPSGETQGKLVASIKAGNPYHLGNANGIGTVLVVAEEGVLVPLTDMIKEIGMDKFGPNSLFPIDGVVWGYPYDYNFCFWFYRKDIFKERGLSVPRTWAQFIENAKACTYDANKDGIIDMYGLCNGIGSSPVGLVDWINTAFMWAEGVEIFDKKWNVVFDSPKMKPKVVSFLKFFKDLYPYMVPGAANTTFGDLIKNFVSGRAAMSPYTGRMVHNIDKNAPELSDKFGIFSYPNSDGSKFSVTNALDYWFVTKTKYVEESRKLLKWLITDKLIDFLATLPLHYQPVLLPIYDDPRWKSLPLVVKYPDVVKELKSFLTRKDMIITAVDEQGPKFDKKVAKITANSVMPEMFQNLLLKSLAPEQCVEIAAKKIKELMA